jgi:hypothetical protein
MTESNTLYICGREGCNNTRKKDRKYCSRKCANIKKKEYKHTEDAKRRMKEKRRGKKHSKEWCENISRGILNSGKTTKGRKRPKEEIDRIKKSLVGSGAGKYERTPEILQKMSSRLKGRKYTKESNERRSRTLKRKIANGEIIRRPQNPSKPEIAWGEAIEKTFNIVLKSSHWIKNKCFDYKYKNYLFELDGSY